MEETYVNGELILINKTEAMKIYKEDCVRYVNEKVHRACNNHRTNVDLEKEYLYKELIDELKTGYKTLSETEIYLTISWADEQEII